MVIYSVVKISLNSFPIYICKRKNVYLPAGAAIATKKFNLRSLSVFAISVLIFDE